jgi:hypothetical protein
MADYFDPEKAEQLLAAGVEAYQPRDSDEGDSEPFIPVPPRPLPKDRNGSAAEMLNVNLNHSNWPGCSSALRIDELLAGL